MLIWGALEEACMWEEREAVDSGSYFIFTVLASHAHKSYGSSLCDIQFSAVPPSPPYDPEVRRARQQRQHSCGEWARFRSG